jgi:hypothetical protein
MRDMAKAMMRFSWAMSVFGLEQMRKLVADEYSGRRADEVKGAFDSMSDSTGRLLSKRSLALYEAGDKLQRESVDILFDLVRPAKADNVVDKATDIVERPPMPARRAEERDAAGPGADDSPRGARKV